MAIDPITNFVRGQLTSSVSNSTNTFPVGDASSFPDPSTDGAYNIVAFDAATYDRPSADPAVEIVRVTGRNTTSDELTVSRGQENTTAEPHPSSTVLHQAITASVVSQIDSQKLGDGEDFDGQSTSELSNLKSVDTGDLSVAGQNGVELPQDVSGSRSFGVWETNTSGSPIFVSVTAAVAGTDASADDMLGITAHINDSQNNKILRTQRTQTSDGSKFIIVSISMLVPGGAEYKVDLSRDDSGAGFLDKWNEQKVGV